MKRASFPSSVQSISLIESEINRIVANVSISDSSIDLRNVGKSLEEYYIEKYSSTDSASRKYAVIDLFCGAGGLSVGLEHEGFFPIAAVDKDLASLRTYHFNRPWLPQQAIIHDDIRNLIDKKIFPHVPVVVGGPPCQGFSVANKHKKDHDDRNELHKFYIHAVQQSSPHIFLIENVEGILSLYENIQEDFSKIGFIVCKPIILSPKDLGFPQSRKRAFILGINAKYKKHAEALYLKFQNSIKQMLTGPKFTLGDAIGDLPELVAKTTRNATNVENVSWGYTFTERKIANTTYTRLVNDGLGEQFFLLNHKSKYNNERDIQIYQTLKPGEKSDAESIQDINPYKSRAAIFRDKFDKLIAEEPCKAITAHMYYDCNMYIHPSQARGLTPREAARVQGFPDDYLFLGSPNEWYRQIGNAVSPLVARVIGKALVKVLEGIQDK